MRRSSPFTLSAVEVNHYCFFLLDSSLSSFSLQVSVKWPSMMQISRAGIPGPARPTLSNVLLCAREAT